MHQDSIFVWCCCCCWSVFLQHISMTYQVTTTVQIPWDVPTNFSHRWCPPGQRFNGRLKMSVKRRSLFWFHGLFAMCILKCSLGIYVYNMIWICFNCTASSQLCSVFILFHILLSSALSVFCNISHFFNSMRSWLLQSTRHRPEILPGHKTYENSHVLSQLQTTHAC